MTQPVSIRFSGHETTQSPYRPRGLILALILSVFCCTTGFAVDYTWTGGGDGVSWEDTGNWNVGGSYPDDSDDRAFIDNAAAQASGMIVLGGALQLHELRIAPTVTLDIGAYDLHIRGDIQVTNVGDGTASVIGSGHLVVVSAGPTNTTIFAQDPGNDLLEINKLELDDGGNGTTVTIGDIDLRVLQTLTWTDAPDVIVTTGSSFAVPGLTIPASDQLSYDGAALEVSGDLVVNGTLLQSANSTVTFSDYANSNIRVKPGNNPTALPNVTVGADVSDAVVVTAEVDMVVEGNWHVNNAARFEGGSRTVTFPTPMVVAVDDFDGAGTTPPNFDGTIWNVTAGGTFPVTQNTVVADGPNAAHMGDGNGGVGGGNMPSIDTDVLVPANAALELEYRVDGTDGETYDWMRFFINGGQVASFFSDTGGWQPFQYDLSAFAGQVVNIQVQSFSLDALFPVNYYVDEIELVSGGTNFAMATGTGVSNFNNLIIANQLTIGDGTDMRIAGDLQILSTGSLIASSTTASTITIEGTFDNDGSFTAGISQVVFAGATPMLPDTAETFYDIEIAATTSAVARADYRVLHNWIATTSAFNPGAFTVTFEPNAQQIRPYTFFNVVPGAGPHHAFACDVDNMTVNGPNLNTKIEGTQAQYVQIEAVNIVRWITADPGGGDENFFWVDLGITEDPSTITNIDLTFVGQGDAATNFQIWVMNQTTGQWQNLGTIAAAADTDVTLTVQVPSNFSDFVVDGNLTWGTYQTDTSDLIRVDFVGATVTSNSPAGYVGTAATTFNDVVIDPGTPAGSPWTLQDGQDITVADLTVSANGLLALQDMATVRLGSSATINGSLTATGNTPTITDTGSDYSFTVAGGAGTTFDIDRMNFNNPNDNGMRFLARPAVAFDIDNVNFADDDGLQSGTYINLNYATAGPAVNFSGCAFDFNCAVNVHTDPGSAAASVIMDGASGAKGDSTYEDDAGAGSDGDNNGSIRWNRVIWTNGAGTGLWNNIGNWSTGAVPGPGAQVLIPDTTVIGACTLDITVSGGNAIGSLIVDAQGQLSSDNGGRVLETTGNVELRNGVGPGILNFAVNDQLIVGGGLSNAGTFTHAGANLTVATSVSNSGVFTNTGIGFSVSGPVTNDAGGTFNPGTATITGDFSNAGTFDSGGTSNIRFDALAGTITSAGASFNILSIVSGSTYVALDDLTISTTFTLPGTLEVREGFFPPAGPSFISAGGEVLFNGVVPQSIPSARFNRLTIDNAVATVTAVGNFSVSDDLTIRAGASLAGGAQTISLGGGAGWVLDGVFQADTSTVECLGTNQIGGSVVTTFNNLDITAAGDLSVGNIATLQVAGTFTNDGTFTEGFSTVDFTGLPSTVAGTQITRFNNLTISGVLQIDPGIAELHVRNVWQNDGSFVSPGTTVRFVRPGLDTLMSDDFEAETVGTDPSNWTVHDHLFNGDDINVDNFNTQTVRLKDDATIFVGSTVRFAGGIERAVNTLGARSLDLQYRRRPNGLDAVDAFSEFFFSQWSGDAGQTWNTIEMIRTPNNTWTTVQFALPSGAENNPDFRLRFLTNGNGNGEGCRVDDVILQFQPISAGTIAGSNPTTFDTLIVDTTNNATLTIDGTDDVTVTSLLTLNAGATLNLLDAAVLRLGVGMDVDGGSFVTSGNKPTLTDTGGDFSFVVQNAGVVDIDGLIFRNPDVNGLTIATTASVAVDVDAVSFEDDDSVPTGSYLRMLRTTGGPYTFSTCDFDLNCEFNVVSDPTVGASFITMTGFGGAGGGEGLEDEDYLTAGQQTATPGTIEWPFKTWNGSLSNSWTLGGNWTPAGIPANADRVVIPDGATTPNDARLDQNPPALQSTIASLLIEDGGIMDTDIVVASHRLLVSGSVTIEADAGAGAPGQLLWSAHTEPGSYGLKAAGTFTNNGEFFITRADPLRLEFLNNFVNTGTFANQNTSFPYANLSATEGLLIAGDLINSGSFVPVDNADPNANQLIQVNGDWNNQAGGTFETGPARVLLAGTSGLITSSGVPFSNLEIPAGATYRALDDLTVNMELRVDGHLILDRALIFGGGATMVTGTGTIEFGGTVGQTIPVPPGSTPFYNLVVSNSSAAGATLGGNIEVDNDFTIFAGGHLFGSLYTMIVRQHWQNDGDFTAESSTIQFSGVASQVRGSALTVFNNLTIAAGDLSIATTAMPANQVEIRGTWTNNAVFSPASSTVLFGGAGAVIDGTAATQFHNLSIASAASLSVGGSVPSIDVSGTWTTDGLFVPGSSVVRFTDSNGHIAGSSNTDFNVVQVQAGGTLTIDGNDDVTVTGEFLPAAPDNAGLLVRNGGTLNLLDNAVLHLGDSLSIGTDAGAGGVLGGTLHASGSPTISDLAFNPTGTKYAFDIWGGTVDVDNLVVRNVDAGGVTVHDSTNFNVDFDNVTFLGGNPTAGIYLNLLYTTVSPVHQFSFTGLFFDTNCFYNVRTMNTGGSAVVTMTGFAGPNGDAFYEADNQNSPPFGAPGDGRVTVADPEGQGSIVWQLHVWDNDSTDGLWSTPSNWNPDTVPDAVARVIIPDRTSTNGAGPTLDVTTTVGSILVEDNGEILSDNNGRMLTVSGNLAIENVSSSGNVTISANDRVTVGNGLVNNGSFTHNGDGFALTGALTNNGTWVNGGATTGATIAGDISNTGSMTLGVMRVIGSFTNSGTLVAGAGTVTFGDIAGTAVESITSGGQSFNQVVIESNHDYTALDTLSASGNLDVNGTLRLEAEPAFSSGSFDATSGLVVYNGSVAQTLVTPAGGAYYDLTVDNSSAGGVSANSATINNDLNIASGVLNGVAATLTITRDWINDGTFNGDSSTVAFNGVDSDIRGGVTTEFHNLTISAANLAANTTAVPADQIRVYGTWTNDAAFTPGASEVVFTGPASQIAGSNVTSFNNLTIDTPATLSIGAVQTVDINGVWTQDGAFTTGSSIVRFVSVGGAISGTAVFNVVQVENGAVLTLDGTDDVTIRGDNLPASPDDVAWLVRNGGTANLQDNAVARLGVSGLSVGTTAVNGGTFNTTGSPTVTDLATNPTGPKFAFNIWGGDVDIDGLSVINIDANGLTVQDSANYNLDIDGVSFQDGNLATGIYIRLLYSAIPTNQFSFSNCSFDNTCLFNVHTEAGASDSSVIMTGFSGPKGDPVFEDDRGGGVNEPFGSITWTLYTWDNDSTDGLWSTATNWFPDLVPPASATIVIPDRTTTNNAGPTLNINTTVGSAQVQDNGQILSDNAGRTLVITGSLSIANTSTAGDVNFSANDQLTVNLDIDNDGTFTHQGDGLSIGRDLLNDGTFVNGGNSAVVGGAVNNTGALTLGTIQVKGSFTNSGTLTAGTGTVSFGDSVGSGTLTLTSGGEAFFNASIFPGYTYQTIDALTVNGLLDIDGRLELQSSLAFGGGATFDATAGVVAYTGSNPQTVVAPPGSAYAFLELANSSGAGVDAATFSVNNDLTIASGIFNGLAETITVSGDWINDATFNGGSSTVAFNGGASTIRGSNNSSFENLTIAAGTLAVSTTAVPADQIIVGGTWSNNVAGGFVAGNSTVVFSGPTPAVSGSNTTAFNDLTIDTATSLSITAGTALMQVVGIIANNGSGIASGAHTVEFTGGAAGISGNPLTLNAMTLGSGATLNLDGADDLQVDQAIVLASGETIALADAATFRLGTGITVQGTFNAAVGTIQTITDTGSRFAFTVDGGTVDMDDLNFINPDANGLRILDSANKNVGIAGISFSGGDAAAGIYLNFLYTGANALQQGDFIISNCSFDANCFYNVRTMGDAADESVVLTGFSGARGDAFYEADKQNTPPFGVLGDGQDPPGAGADGGAIRWSVYRWTNGDLADSDWSTPGNWSPAILPPATATVIIPDRATTAGAGPTVDLNTTVGAIRVEDNGEILSDTLGRVLTVSGNVVVENVSVQGVINFGAGDRIDIGGDLNNDGSFTHSADDLAIGGNLNNTGTFTNGGAGATVTGTVTNSGTLTLGTIRVLGSFDNSGTLVAGANKVTFGDLVGTGSGTIVSGGESFNDVLIESGYSYTATDTLTTSGVLDVNGTLLLSAEPAMSLGGFDATGGVVTYNGTVPQTMVIPPGGAYYDLRSENSSGAGLTMLTVTVNNDISIVSGIMNGSNAAIAVGRDWSNDGTFTAGTSTVTFSATGAMIRGSAITRFHNLTIGAGTLTLNTTTAPADAVEIAGTWTHNVASGFVPGSSTVTFTGNPSTVAGSNTTSFANVTIDAGATLAVSSTGTTIQVANVLNNDGSGFAAGSYTVDFTGLSASVAGNPLVIDTVTLATSANLILDGTDDLQIDQSLLIEVNESMSLQDTATLRLGTGLTVEGNLTAAPGSTQTITDTGSNFAFVVNGGVIDIDDVNFANPDANGLQINDTTGIAIDIDNVNFTGGNPVSGIYLNLLYNANPIATGDFTFAGCSFDANCLYNVHTEAGLGPGADGAVRMVSASGVNGVPAFEDDRGAGEQPPSPPPFNGGTGGSILWSVAVWDNDSTDGLWSNPSNWDPDFLPAVDAIVVIPDRTTSNGAGPTLDLNTTVGSVTVQDNGEILSDNVGRTLTVTGAVQVDFTATTGTINFSPNDRLSVGGDLNNDGVFTHQGNGLTVTGDVTNDGAFTNGGTNAVVSGSVNNTNSMTLGSLRIVGSLVNSGTLTPGTGTVTFGDIVGTGTGNITLGGQALNGVTIEPNYTYTALDAFTVNGLLDVNGVLEVDSTLAFGGGASFDATAGTVAYVASTPQTIAVPPGSDYFDLRLANSSGSGVDAADVSVTNDLEIASGIFNGLTHNIRVSRDWTNNGTFSAGTSTVMFNGGVSTIRGANVTSFANLNIAAGTLAVATTSVPADAVTVGGTWTLDVASGFVAGSSNVTFSGPSVAIAGTNTTEFNDLTIDAGTVLPITAGTSTVQVRDTLTNNGNGIAAGTHTVEFTGVSSAIAGNALVFDSLALGPLATLTIDGTDDVQVDQAMTIASGETLVLDGTATLRIGTSLTVQGALQAVAGTVQTITDTGSKFAFTVDGGDLNLDDLTFSNPDSNGLRVLDSANKNVDIDGVSFAGGTAVNGIYLNLLYDGGNALLAGDFTFSGLVFDANCFYNVRTMASAADSSISMLGFGGLRGDPFYEADKQDTPPFGVLGDGQLPVGDGGSGGAIIWEVYTWTNLDLADSDWSTPGNWIPTQVPPPGSRVIIPDRTTTLGAGPTLNLNTSIGSLLVEDNGEVLSDGLGRVLTLTGSVTVANVAMVGVINLSANDRMDIGGSLDNDGTFTHNGDNLNITGNLDNAGTFTNGGTGAVVGGAVQNDGTLNTGTMRIVGSLTNTSVIAAGTGTVTFGDTVGSGSGTITSAGASFNNLVVLPSFTFTAVDTLTVAANLDVDGTLEVSAEPAFSAATFDATAGTVRYNGTVAQTVVIPTGNFYFDLVLANSSAGGASSAGGFVLTNDDLVIESGIYNGGNTFIIPFGDWVNDGTFNANNSTVIFVVNPSVISGTSTTRFNVVSVNSGTLSISTPTTVPADNIEVQGSFLSNVVNGFIPGTSTVTFTGAAASVGGSQITQFNDCVIAAGAQLTVGAGLTTQVNGTLTNNGNGIAAGSHTVEFTGTNSAIAGNALTIDTVAFGAGATLTLDGSDDLQVQQAMTVEAGETLALAGTATLRLAVGVTVQGALTAAAGSVQDIVDTGSNFSFVIDGGDLDLDDVNVTNVDANGVQVNDSTNFNVDIDGINFTGSAGGPYINLLYNVNPIAASTFVFSGCSFDAACTFNVHTEASAAALAVAMTGFSGAKGGAAFEDDNGIGENPPGMGEVGGSITWSLYNWTNGVGDTLWSTPGNWNPPGPPTADATVVVNLNGPNLCILDINTTVGAVDVQATGFLWSDNGVRTLNVTGDYSVAAGGIGATNANDGMTVGGDVVANGLFGTLGSTLSVAGNVDVAATGSYFSGTNAVIDGNLTSAGTLNLNVLRVKGDFVSTGSIVPGAGTVTLGDTVGSGTRTLTTTGQSFNNLVIEPNYVYEATDTLNIDGDLDVNGTLNLNAEPGMAFNTATFEATAGTVVYNGTVAQTVVAPPGGAYYNLSAANSSASGVDAVTVTVNNDLNIVSGTLDGSIATLMVGRDWINDGNFDRSTSTVIFNNGASTIRGSAITRFENLTIDTGSLAVSTTTAPADAVELDGAWTNNIASGFVAGGSTVTLRGATTTIAGTETTEFNNLTIAAGAQLQISSTGTTMELRGALTNSGNGIAAGSHTVRFTGPLATFSGNAIVIDTVAFGAFAGLTLDGSDDVQVDQAMTVGSGTSLALDGTAILRLDNGMTVQGTLSAAAGGTQTITNAGGSGFSFTVDGGTLDLDDVNITNPDANGVRVLDSANKAVDLDDAIFTGQSPAGTYINLLYTGGNAPLAGDFTFTGNSFDGNCTFNVHTEAGQDGSVAMENYFGVNGAPAFEDDRGAGEDPVGNGGVGGSIIWRAAVWDNGSGDGLWSNPLNWDPDFLPTVNTPVQIPDTTVIGPPTLDLDTTVSSVTVQDDGQLFSDNGTRVLTVTNTFNIQDTGAPAVVTISANDRIVVGGLLDVDGTLNYNGANLSASAVDNSGTFVHSGNGLTVTNNLDNTGTFTNGGTGATVSGDVNNTAGSLTLGSIRVVGSFVNSATLVPGTGTVTFGAAAGSGSGNITLGGQSLNDAVIAANHTFTTTDTLTVNGTLDVDGILALGVAHTVGAAATMNVNSGGELQVGVSLDIDGNLTLAGPATITDTGSKFAFTVTGASANVDIDNGIISDLDDNGLSIDTASTTIDIDNTSFTDSVAGATGTYIRFLANVGNPAASTFNFTSLSFDVNCQYNVSTHAGMTNDQVIVLATSTGAKAGATYENDRGSGGTINPGSIEWPAVTWTGAVSADWSNPLNWSPTNVPLFTDSVVIPDIVVASPPFDPVLDVSATIAFLTVEDGGNLTTTGNGRTLSVVGSLNIEPDSGSGGGVIDFASDGGGLSVGTTLTNDGTLTLSSDNTATHTFGTVVNNGTLTLNDNNLSVSGDWTNSDTVNEGTSQVTFNGTATQNITSASNWDDLVITNATQVTFLDGFTAASLTNNTAGSQVNFQANNVFTITDAGGFSMAGAVGTEIVLARNGGSGSDFWELALPGGGPSVDAVRVSNSVKSPSGNHVNPSNSFDDGNNFNWFQDAFFLTTTVTPGAGGSVDEVDQWAHVNAMITVTATANATYQFVQWNLDSVRQENGDGTAVVGPFMVTMDSDHTLDAEFLIETQDSEGVNGDGLPDWWELQKYGGLTETDTTDSDSDGYDSLQEYFFDTNPRDNSSPTVVYVNSAGSSVTGDGMTPATAYKYLDTTLALPSVASGSVIELAAGVYELSNFDLTKDIYIRGAEASQTIIKGPMAGASSSTDGQMLRINTSRMMLANVTLRLFNDPQPIISYGDGDVSTFIVLRDLIITGNDTAAHALVAPDPTMTTAPQIYFYNNLMYGNTGTAFGLELNGSPLRLVHCTLVNNTHSSGCLRVSGTGSSHLGNSIIRGNSGTEVTDATSLPGSLVTEFTNIEGAGGPFDQVEYYLNVAEGNFRLHPDPPATPGVPSPGIDAGTVDYTAVDGVKTIVSADLNLVPRSEGTGPDLGAYEVDTADFDNDGLLNVNETTTDPYDNDSDGDTLDDGDEAAAGTQPDDPDSDSDNVPDGIELSLSQKATTDDTEPRPGTYVEDFEGGAWPVGPLTAVLPNQLSAGAANIQTTTVYSGSQAIEIVGNNNPISGSYGYAAIPPTLMEYWVEFAIIIPSDRLPTDYRQSTHFAGANLAVNPAGLLAYYDGEQENWILDPDATPVPAGWFIISLHRTVADNKIDVYLDQRLVFANMTTHGYELANHIRSHFHATDGASTYFDFVEGFLFNPFHIVGFAGESSSSGNPNEMLTVTLTDSPATLRTNPSSVSWQGYWVDGMGNRTIMVNPGTSGVLNYAAMDPTEDIDLTAAIAEAQANGSDIVYIELSSPTNCSLARFRVHTFTFVP